MCNVTAENCKTLYDTLDSLGCFEYGGTFTREEVIGLLRVKYIKKGTRADFQTMDLAELAGVGYIRNVLINQGKWIKLTGDHYRVLTPSENADQIESFLSRGRRAFNKANKLAKSTPPEYFKAIDQTKAKIAARIKSSKETAELNNQLRH